MRLGWRLAGRLLLGLLPALAFAAPPAQAIDTNLTDYGWSENAGYLGAAHGIDPAAAVLDDDGADAYLKGYLWGENVGWIKLGDGTGPYANSGIGDWGVNVAQPAGGIPAAVTGRAWSENAGWLVFDPTCADDATCAAASYDWDTGNLEGYAWSENLGWIHLRGGSYTGGGVLYSVGTVPEAGIADVPGPGDPAFLENDNSCTMPFVVTLNKAPIRNSVVQVDFSVEEIAPPSAVDGADFTAATGSVTVTGPTATTGTLDVALLNDRVAGEGDEYFRVRISKPTGEQVAIADDEAAGIVSDDDRSLQVQILGDGRVTSIGVTGSPSCGDPPPDVDCTSSCSNAFTLGETVQLHAAGTPPSAFVGWAGGGCSGTADCFVTVAGDATVTARFERDGDGDGVPDTTDNCPETPNPGQEDRDGDGRGDLCDGDTDGDGVADAVDNCPTVSNADQSDVNLDGRGDACQVKMADSGQILCYTAGGALALCPATGQDGDYPPRIPTFGNNPDGTVSDPAAGLTWQDTASPSYNWYQAAGVTNPDYNASGESVCGTLADGGHEDWRLPSREELGTLVNVASTNPATFAAFTQTTNGGYWTADRVPTTDEAWGVMFTNGTANLATLATTYSVRCVRGAVLDLTHRLVDNGDGTVSDPVNGVMWQQHTASPGKTFSQAESICENLSLGDYPDWRLPSRKELLTIADYGQRRPAVNLATFPGTRSAPYWTRDGDVLAGNSAWTVNFEFGSFLPQDRDTPGFIRCVRGVEMHFNEIAAGGPGTVEDGGTSLVWQQSHNGPSVTWAQSLAYCEALSLDNQDDWRLPNVKELESITDTALATPSLDTGLFAGLGATDFKFWTSTTDVRSPGSAWGVHFDAGHSFPMAKAEPHYARCVRGGFEGTLAVDLVARWDLPEGALAGRVTAAPAGDGESGPIDCTVRLTAPGPGDRPGLDAGQCTDIYSTQPATAVTLTADPLRTAVIQPYLTTPGLEPSVFAGWSGDACAETPFLPAGSTCALSVTGDLQVYATFLRDTDADRDNVWDSEDNCPVVYNPLQIDTDIDGRGDACEVRLPDTGQEGDYSVSFGEDADYVIHPPAYHGFAVRAGTAISFHDTLPPTIQDAAGGFGDAGFEPGDQIKVQGSAGGFNDGTYTVAAVAPSQLTLVSADLLAPQPAGPSVTVANTLSGVVADRNTHLIWQAQDDGATHNWYQAAGVSGNAFNPASSAVDVCGDLTLADHSDWRLPTRQELLTIVDYGSESPAVETAWFTGPVSERYWTATSFPGDAPAATNAWAVDFTGGLASFAGKGEMLPVRCVRTAEVDFGDLADNGDDTVADAATGLSWQRTPPAGAVSWAAAIDYCEGLSHGLRDDWRLPNVRELVSITRDDLPAGPAADPAAFPGAPPQGFWASTTSVQNPPNAWFVNFADGSTSPFGPKTAAKRVRCVTGGQPGSTGSADLAVSITDDLDPVVCSGPGCGSGTDVTYTVTVTNLGPEDALGVSLADTIPAGTVFVGAVPTPGMVCTPDAAGVTCVVPALPSGASAVVDVTVTPPAGPGFFTDAAAVTSLTNDAFPANDAAVEQTWAGIFENRLTVQRQGTGSGSVLGLIDPPIDPAESPAGIDCGADCTEVYPLGTLVRLSATADVSALFGGWTGGGCPGTGDCVIQLNAYSLVKAAFVLDSDGDGIPDSRDNCDLDANPGQADLDFDGTGDACDADADGDGADEDGTDNCVGLANASQADTDGDGTGDACEVRLTDSGQNAGYTATFGEDADYLINPPSFRAVGLLTAASISFENTSPAAIADSAGGFLASGFAPGDTIRVQGSLQGLNDDAFVVAQAAPGRLTLAAGDTLEEQPSGERVTLTNGPFLRSAAVSFVPGHPAEIFDNDRGFVAAGFRAGDQVSVGGSQDGLNDGTYRVETVFPERLVLAPGETLLPDTAPSVLASSGISFGNDNPDTIRDAGAGLLAAGFSAGDRVLVAGSAGGANDGIFTIAMLTADTITLADTDGLSAAVAGPVVTLTETAVVTVRSLGGGTVLDENTHLVWQREPSDGTLDWTAAGASCGSLVLAGHGPGAWRLPTRDELAGIADYGRLLPALDGAFFPDPAGGRHWTGTVLTDPTWVDMDSGDTGTEAAATTYRVRCVRGAAPTFRAYADAVDDPALTVETAPDRGSGLIWERSDAQNAAGSTSTWEEALAYCEGLTVAFEDWRLPNVRELASISNPARTPAVNTTIFPGVKVDAPYWSSSTDLGNTASAWTVTFSDGTIAPGAKDGAGYVRCVRGGRSGAIGEADLRVEGVADRDPVIVGSAVDYVFTVTNDGWLGADGVTLTYDLPPGTAYRASSALPGSCAEAGGTVTCDLGLMANGGAAVVTVGIDAPAVPGTILNTATVFSATYDPVPGNDAATVATIVDPDADTDDVPDSIDNCPGVTNADQLDTDLDGIGDACDGDDDADGVPDPDDNCVVDLNPDQLDTDGDRAGDVCDVDRDGDGVDNVLDNCDTAFNPSQADTDDDGLGDVCEIKLPDTGQTAGATATFGEDADYDLNPPRFGPHAVLAADTLAFAAGPPAMIVDGAAGFVAAGFGPGDTLSVSGSAGGANDGVYTVALVSPSTLALAPGSVLADEAAGATVVLDNNLGDVARDDRTHLMWPRAASTLYLTQAQAADYCSALAIGTYPGGTYADWRLPAKKELYSILDFGRFSPALDPAIFPGAETALYWTATGIAGAPSGAWSVDFLLGHAGATPLAVPALVRCVRGAPLAYPNPGAAAGNAFDELATGLAWQLADPTVPDPTLTPMDWEGALAYCEGLSLESEDDWRLPNVRELESLVPDDLALSFLPGVFAESYWSSTTSAITPTLAWSVSFADGSVSTSDKAQDLYVRCVRGGVGGGIGNADVAVAMATGTPDPVTAGRDLTWLLDVTNLGPHDASGVVLADILPAGAVFQSATWDPAGVCTETSGTVTCAIGDLAAGATIQVTLLVSAPPTAGDITNTASVSSATNDEDLSNNEASDATVTVQYQITVQKDEISPAAGIVASTVPSASDIDCGADCTETYAGATDVTLTATETTGFFYGWTGSCTGTADCDVNVAGDVFVGAVFTPHRLTVVKSGGGVQHVGSSAGGGIDCGGDCAELFTASTEVTLTATPDPGFFFYGWTGGGCGGTGACTLTVDGDVQVEAVFTPYRLVVTLAGDLVGTSSVTSVPAGIGCEGDCSELYLASTPVALTANPGPGSWFNGWTGGGCSGVGTCDVTVDGDVAVTAWFVVPPTVDVDPSSHDFGVVVVGDGSSAARVFEVGNTGTADLLVSALSLTGAGSAAFSITAESCIGATVAAGATCPVTVRFLPAAGGAFAADLVVASNDPTSPLAVGLTGTGDDDPDGDGVIFGVDNCPWDANPGQEDWDLDGPGDVCDNCPFNANTDQSDADDNGSGDGCGPVTVPATGQNWSWLPDDDGFIRAGLPWPDPRFTNPDGSLPVAGAVVLDNLTGLMWLRDANCIKTQYPGFRGSDKGRVKWPRSMDFVAGINAGTFADCGAGFDDWRLPNVNELESLANVGRISGVRWLKDGGFLRVVGTYWSSTGNQSAPAKAWSVNFASADIRPLSRTRVMARVLPVRGTAGGPSRIWQTGQTSSWRTGDDGSLGLGEPWPVPRLAALPDGTFKDELTGLLWPDGASSPGPAACGPGLPLKWAGALSFVRCLNANDYLGHDDWRLPNRRELRTMVNYGSATSAGWPAGLGVTGVRARGYWTASTYIKKIPYAWALDVRNGLVKRRLKRGNTDRSYIWPVRGGVVPPILP